jgi:hypothetical protein
MSQSYKSHKAAQNQRLELLLDAAKIFIDRGTPVMVTEPQSTTPIDNQYIISLEQVELALANNPSCNLAAIVGQNHNLIAIKFESEGSYSQDPMELLAEYEQSLGSLPTTMTINYSGNEQYRFFNYPVGRDIQKTRFANEITILKNNMTGTNGLVLLEPSNLYGETVSEVSHSDRIATLPERWIEYICSCPEEEQVAIESPDQLEEHELEYLPVPAVIEEHEFHDAPRDGHSEDDYAEMDDETLLQAIVEQLTLFRDEMGDPCFFCEGAPFTAPSKFVEDWARHQFYKIRKYGPNRKLVRSVFDMLESLAKFESAQIRLFNRVARKEDAILYDLGNNKCLTVTTTGWEVIPSFPQFRRYKHQLEQLEPLSGGNPWEVFEYIAVPEENRLLILVYLVTLFSRP